MNSVLVGMFDTQAAADKARSALVAAGFSPSLLPANSVGAAADDASREAGAEGGGFMGWLHGIFGGDDSDERQGHATQYESALRRGAIGLSVPTTSDADTDRAAQILNDAGAVDIDERSRAEGWTDTTPAAAKPMAAAAGTAGLAAGAKQTLKVVEENLAVGKRAVARGGVRVFSRVVEVPVEESVRLREEHTSVERRVVDRPATEADFAAFKEGSIEVRDMGEEAVVGKTARVVGEVEIGQRVTERDEVVRDTVRKTQVDVEQLDGDSISRTSLSSADSARSSGSVADSRSGSANLDPITGEPGAHPVGTGVGAAAGGVAAGALAGSIAGPVGTVVGAAVGAVAGGLAGKGVAEKVDPTTGKA